MVFNTSVSKYMYISSISVCQNIWPCISGSSRNIPVPHLCSWIQVCLTFIPLLSSQIASILSYEFSVLSELLLPTNSLVGRFWTSTTTARRLCNTGELPVMKGNVQASPSRYRWNVKLLFPLCFMILQGCLLFPSGVSNFPLGMYSPGSVLYSYSIYFYLQLPKKQFRYASEFTSRAELEALALDLDSLRLQSLIICERILGTQHKVSNPF